MAGLVAALFAGAVMAQAQPAPATEAAPAAASAAAPAAAETKPAKAKSDKICVEEVQTGSHFRRKICASREEWARRRAKDQEAMTDTGGAPMR